MKIAVKYGIYVTAAIVAWLALKHFVLHFDPGKAAPFDLIVFNLAAVLGVLFGIRDRRRISGGALFFSQGIKTGMSIVVTYTVLTSLYFALELLAFGTQYLQQESGAGTQPTGPMVAKAFAGLILGFLLMGLIYSVLISLVLKSRVAR